MKPVDIYGPIVDILVRLVEITATIFCILVVFVIMGLASIGVFSKHINEYVEEHTSEPNMSSSEVLQIYDF